MSLPSRMAGWPLKELRFRVLRNSQISSKGLNKKKFCACFEMKFGKRQCLTTGRRSLVPSYVLLSEKWMFFIKKCFKQKFLERQIRGWSSKHSIQFNSIWFNSIKKLYLSQRGNSWGRHRKKEHINKTYQDNTW